MSKVKTFRTKVKDELSWPYPSALVAVRHWSQSSQETGISEDCKGDYDVESAIEAISYRGNYWPDIQSQVDDLKSRPLINLDNPDDPQLFKVDLTHLQSVQVRNSTMGPEDKKWRLIELDITRRFA